MYKFFKQLIGRFEIYFFLAMRRISRATLVLILHFCRVFLILFDIRCNFHCLSNLNKRYKGTKKQRIGSSTFFYEGERLKQKEILLLAEQYT